MSDVKSWEEAPNLWEEEPDETDDNHMVEMVEDDTCGSETDNTMLYELIAEQFEGLADLFYKLANKETQ